MAAEAGPLLKAASIASQEATRLALNVTGVVVWEWTFGEDTVIWGDGLELVYGRTRDQVGFEGWKDFVHPEDLPRISSLIEHAAATQSPYEGEFRVYWPDGSEHWVLVRGHVYENSGGRPPKLAGMLMNITARKREESRRRDREERLLAALTASRTGTFRWDMRTNELEWDEQLNQLFGLRNGETVRTLDQFLACVHPEDRPKVIADCERCVQLGQDFELEYRVVWPDGSIRWLYDRGKAYFDREGIPNYITGACVDVTERRQAAEALRQSEQDLRLIIDSMPALVGYVDRDLTYRRVNRTYEEWFGIPAEKIVGMHVRQLSGDAVFEKTIEYRSRALAGERVVFETDFPGADGTRFLEANFIPCHASDGSVPGFAVLTSDVTDRKRAEEALRKQEKLALIGRLTSSIAHEINNPLEAVINLLFLAETEQDPEAARSHIKDAQRELSRVSQIATNALQFHRPQVGPAPVNICALLDSVLSLFEARVRNGRIAVQKDYPSSATVLATENELRQVFANLLTNACDALGQGPGTAHPRIVLRVRERRLFTGETHVFVTFADSGTGMTADSRRRLFEPFFSTKENKGTGLGLWISREIVTKHGGKIRVKSSPGYGTVFQIALPVSSPPANNR